jgi:hypothetical protein
VTKYERNLQSSRHKGTFRKRSYTGLGDALDPGQAGDWHTYPHDDVYVDFAPAKIILKVCEREPVNRALQEGFTQYVAVGSKGQARHRLINSGGT